MKNKIKTALSVLILLAFAIIGGGSAEELGAYIIVIAVVFVLATVVMFIVKNHGEKERMAKEQKEAEKNKAIKLAEVERIIQNYEIQKNDLIAKYGNPDAIVYIKEYDINEEIIVYETKKKVIIRGKEFAFIDILSCTFSDNPTMVKGKILSVSDTKTDNGNALGRAIVGGAIAGPAGAIIGGTTAKRQTQTEYRQENDKIYHNYTVIINVNSISNPIIRINTGDNGRLTNEIVGLMNVVISRK